MTPRISIVAPMYNEELCIEKFVNSTIEMMDRNQYEFELILVDDGSKDKTYEIIQALALQDKRLRVIKFSRNFGHQMALYAGLKYASNEFIIMIDSDMQHPLDLIPTLIEKAKLGFDIVHTVRKSTRNESLFKKITSQVFYLLINKLSYTPIIPGATDFRLVTRRANNVFCSLEEFDRFNRGLFSWIGFPSTSIEYEADKRYAGVSNYTIRKMISLALSSITSFTGKPLRVSFYAGLLTLSVVGVYLLFIIYYYLLHGAVRGWSSIFFSITLLGSVQLISIGVLGEYIYRIYNEIKRRPHYIIEKQNESEN